MSSRPNDDLTRAEYYGLCHGYSRGIIMNTRGLHQLYWRIRAAIYAALQAWHDDAELVNWRPPWEAK